jgi:hypothetical protein
MNQQEPLGKEELQATQDPTEPVEPVAAVEPVEPVEAVDVEPVVPFLHDHDGLVEPKIKEYVPLEVGIVIFTVAVLALIFFGLFSDMWGLIG